MELARTQVEAQVAQVDTQRRQIELAEAPVQGAQVQLDYCTVRAPFSGVVIAKAAQVGEIVSPLSAGGGFTRTGVGTIVDMDSLEIEVDVTEAYINRVQPNQPAQAVLDAYPDWKIPAHVIAIIPTADRGKATVKVRVAFEQKDPRILPDMGVRVSFLEEAKKARSCKAQGRAGAGIQHRAARRQERGVRDRRRACASETRGAGADVQRSAPGRRHWRRHARGEATARGNERWRDSDVERQKMTTIRIKRG